MANTRFAYVRSFELPDPLLPGTYMVLRIDGVAFHKFSTTHNFTKPNDPRALELMDHAARDLFDACPDIVLAFGESDEYSFLLPPSANPHSRRHAKLLSTLTSLFTSSYLFRWSTYFPDTPLVYPPSFDGRIVSYPTKEVVKDYFKWRQADTHINNLYNTVFWALVQQGGETTTKANAILSGTVSAQKHELLFAQFGINYNTVDERYRKGSIIVREATPAPPITDEQVDAGPAVEGIEDADISEANSSPTPRQDGQNDEDDDDKQHRRKLKKEKKAKKKVVQLPLRVLHCDLIKEEFWAERPWLLEG